MLVALTAWLLRRRLAVLARQRLSLIKRRLPFLLDMLTLLMEAGSSLLQALDEAVHEFRGQPVAEEFGRVLADIRMGRTRTEAFLAMRDRLQDAEIGGVIGSIVQGEHLGTPLAQIFRMQADVLRVKRSAAGRDDRRRGGRADAAARHPGDGRGGAGDPGAVCAQLFFVWV